MTEEHQATILAARTERRFGWLFGVLGWVFAFAFMMALATLDIAASWLTWVIGCSLAGHAFSIWCYVQFQRRRSLRGSVISYVAASCLSLGAMAVLCFVLFLVYVLPDLLKAAAGGCCTR